jgi:LemA protein
MTIVLASVQTEMIPFYIIGGIVLVILVWFIAAYNTFVRLQQHVKESWSGIDTELKRRYNLIPNLVETVKGYAAHEKQTLQAVVEARTRAANSHGSPNDQAQDENMLIGALQRLFALAEGYPDLKASANFLELQKQLADTEDRIQAARRFYNANVRDLNTRCGVFPSNLVAKMFNVQRAEFFEIDDASVRKPVKVDL